MANIYISESIVIITIIRIIILNIISFYKAFHYLSIIIIKSEYGWLEKLSMEVLRLVKFNSYFFGIVLLFFCIILLTLFIEKFLYFLL